MLYPPPGAQVLDRIDGLPAAAQVPGVRTVVFARPGDELWHWVNNGARVGLLYAQAPGAATALARAREAAALVTVRTRQR
jgi:formate-dependent phosphoribosylglycinamide formyltransferase (GAR transformylase)